MVRSYQRVERRRAQDRARILSVAAAKFAAAGPDAVRLDEIGDAADVARATLYTHFESKEALIEAIAGPLIDEGAVLLAGAAQEPDPAKAIDQLLDVYLILYRQYPDAMRVSYMVQGRPLGALARPHGQFLQRVLSILERAGQKGLLRSDDPALSARALARIAVPTLETFSTRPDREELFRSSLRGMLLRG